MIVIFGNAFTVAEILGSYWIVFPVAWVVALLATWVCRKVALQHGIVDMPDASVKTHKKPTAYLGGVGILFGCLAGLAVGIWILGAERSHLRLLHDEDSGEMRVERSIEPPAPAATNDEKPHDRTLQTGGYRRDANYNWVMILAIAAGAVIACVVGVIDDIKDIRPWQKFLGQAIAATILIAAGVRPNFVDLFRLVGVENFPLWLDWALGAPTVMFFILGATNSLNLLDGLDGLCAGVTAIITLAFLALALILATWGFSVVGDPIRLIICLALVGGALGFMPMNRHPARIFMGDAGSMLLGFMAGTLMILFMERFGRWSVAAIIIFGLPILDTAVALFRRAINHKPLFVSDRGHIYDQLMDRGHSLVQTVRFSYFLAILYAVAGLATALMRFRWSIIVFLLLVIVSAWAVWKHGLLQIPGSRSSTASSEGSLPD